jgi:hypothetical protein
MGLFTSKKNKNATELTPEQRAQKIKLLEERRAQINKELEVLMRQYAHQTKTPQLKKRKFRMGKSPNDYKFKP